MSLNDASRIAGWYGKLPTVGDFASRRLDAGFIDPWDHWLGTGLQMQRDRLGDAWLEPFVQSPAWRFVLGPGVLPSLDAQQVMAGVLMPSVDRVGRYFPLTVAGLIGRGPATAGEMESLLAWIDRIENTALEALQADWSIDELEQALAALPSPVSACNGSDALGAVRDGLFDVLDAGGGFVESAPVQTRSDLASVFAPLLGAPAPAPRGPAAGLRGVSLWMADGAVSPQLIASRGLPDLDAFARMFGGAATATPATMPHAQQPHPPQPAHPPHPAMAPFDIDATAPLRAAGSAYAAAAFATAHPPADASVPGSADAAVDAAAHATAAPDDLLAMFAADAPADGVFADPLAHLPPVETPRDDILSMFGASGDAVSFEETLPLAPPPPSTLPAAEPAAHDDLLALFDGDAPASAAPRDADRGDDILDILGAPSTAPAPPPR